MMRNIAPTPARDAVEVEAYSRAPSMVVAVIGGSLQTCNVPAGFGVCTFGLAPGGITVRLYRSNVDQVVVQSPYQVTNTPYVQDLQYVVAGGLR
jgi:hypothetical protein